MNGTANNTATKETKTMTKTATRYCARCNKKMTKDNPGIVGPECIKKARTEAKVFCRGKLGATLEDWFDACDADFAGDQGLTLKQYQAQYGAGHSDLTNVIEVMMNHGLYTRLFPHWFTCPLTGRKKIRFTGSRRRPHNLPPLKK